MNLKSMFLIPLIASALRNIVGIGAEQNCNAINFKAGSDIRTGVNSDPLGRPAFETIEQAKECFPVGQVLIGAEKKVTKIKPSLNKFKKFPNLNKCHLASFEAGRRGKYSSRKELAECSPVINKNSKELFLVEEEGKDKKCPIDLYKPCEGEANSLYNPCYAKNIEAIKNSFRHDGKTIPVYESSKVAKKCFPLKAQYAIQTENKYSIFSLLEEAQDPTGCLLMSLLIGATEVYPDRETLLKCPPDDNTQRFFRVGKDKKSPTFCTVDPKAECKEEKNIIKWG